MNELMLHGGMGLQASGAATVSRAMEEVRGAIFMARQFPRDEGRALKRIEGSCQNVRLAEVAQYAYPRGGQTITGPSIRLAEVIAQSWGNLDFGVKVLDRTMESSHVIAQTWDLETNVRRYMEFDVPHVRDTKKGRVVLTDERDIYEIVANMGARRLRATILAIVPKHIVQAAEDCVENTLRNAGAIEEKRKSIVIELGKHRVTPDQIEERIGKKIHAMTGPEYVQLRKIATSLNDGMSKSEDWFTTLDPEKNKRVRDEAAAAAPTDSIPVTHKAEVEKADALKAAIAGFEAAKRALPSHMKLDEVLHGKLESLNASTDPAMIRAATIVLTRAIESQKDNGK